MRIPICSALKLRNRFLSESTQKHEHAHMNFHEKLKSNIMYIHASLHIPVGNCEECLLLVAVSALYHVTIVDMQRRRSRVQKSLSTTCKCPIRVEYFRVQH